MRMKKFLLLSLAATAMLAGCSNDETLEKVETTPQAIGFDAFVDKSTKATDYTISNLGTMEVFGWLGETIIFNRQSVTVTSTGSCTYTPTQYWEESSTYTFEAVAPDQPSGTTITASKGATSIAFNNSTAGAALDLLYAGPVTKTTSSDFDTDAPTAVAFTFNHLLSRVKFTFKNGFATDSQIKISVKDVTINNAYTSGTITPATLATWDLSGGAQSLVVTFPSTSVENISPDGEAETEHMYLIPSSTATTYTVQFTVTLTLPTSTDAPQNTLTATTPSITMSPGYSYDFTAEIDESNADEDGPMYPIEFTAEITTWQDFTDSGDVSFSTSSITGTSTIE